LGLYFLRARYLDVQSGRFWTQDSFEGSSFDPRSLHKYLYSACDPINLSDPSGYSFLQLVTTVFQKLFVGTLVGTSWFSISKLTFWGIIVPAALGLLYLQAIGTVPGQVTIDSPLKRKFVDEYTKAVIEHKHEVGGFNGACQNLFYVVSVGFYGAHCGQWAKWTTQWFTKAKAQFPEFASIKV
jgi:hypothetical protein